MPDLTPLQPTLWRTCRTIANRTRLEIYGLLLERPGQSVSAVAEHLHLPLSLASEYLRALEGRGLLAARRLGRRVEYRPCPATGQGSAAALGAALRGTFKRETQAVAVIFRLATAFTHPRRIEIFRILQAGPQTLGQIQAATRFSSWAALRHLRKLEARGFVAGQDGIYVVARRPDDLGRELARLAAG